MDNTDLEKIYETINETLKDTCDRLEISRALPDGEYSNEPIVIIDACKDEETFTLKYKLADLMNWQEQDVLSEILFRDRFKATNQ